MTANPAPQGSITVGEVRITYLPDGVAHFAYGVFPGSSDECWVRQAAHTRDGRWVCSIGGFLIESGDAKVMVDLGFGDASLEVPDFVTAKSGQLLKSLSEAGAAPDQINTVVYTHMHADHTGWTNSGDQLTFGEARHVAGPGEVQHWLGHADEAFAPAQQLAFADRFEESVDGETIAPGVTLMHTPGHTPGHQCVVVSSGGERAIILGDTLHTAAQFEEPDLTFMFDVDVPRAREWRDDLLSKLEETGTTVGAAHFSGSAFGRVMKGEGRQYWKALS